MNNGYGSHTFHFQQLSTAIFYTLGRCTVSTQINSSNWGQPWAHGQSMLVGKSPGVSPVMGGSPSDDFVGCPQPLGPAICLRREFFLNGFKHGDWNQCQRVQSLKCLCLVLKISGRTSVKHDRIWYDTNNIIQYDTIGYDMIYLYIYIHIYVYIYMIFIDFL